MWKQRDLKTSTSCLSRTGQTPTWVWDYVDSFIFIVLLWNAKAKQLYLQFLFQQDSGRLFSRLCACFLWIRGNFNASANRCGPSSPQHRSRTLDVTDRSSDSQFSVRLFRGQSIKRDHTMDDTVWEINSSVLAWSVQGGGKKAECGKQKEKRVRHAEPNQNKRSRHKTNEERNLIVSFCWLCLFEL